MLVRTKGTGIWLSAKNGTGSIDELEGLGTVRHPVMLQLSYGLPNWE